MNLDRESIIILTGVIVTAMLAALRLGMLVSEYNRKP